MIYAKVTYFVFTDFFKNKEENMHAYHNFDYR
jgi:hypothetical protein